MYQWTHPFAIRGPGILAKKALPSPFGWIIQHCSLCARKACGRRFFIAITITLSFRGCNYLLSRWFGEFRPCCTHSLTHLGVMLYFYEWDSAGPHSTPRCNWCYYVTEIIPGPERNAIAREKRKGKGNEWVREWEKTRGRGRGAVGKEGREEGWGRRARKRGRERKITFHS